MDIADDPRAPRGPRQDGDAGRDEPATTGRASTVVEDAMALQADISPRGPAPDGHPRTGQTYRRPETGILVNFNPQFIIDLPVTVPGQAPYDLQLTRRSARRPRPAPAGADVSVRVDPSEPHRVAIDWSTA